MILTSEAYETIEYENMPLQTKSSNNELESTSQVPLQTNRTTENKILKERDQNREEQSEFIFYNGFNL